MQIFVTKRSEEAVLPERANPDDAGFDLVAIDNGEIVYGKGGRSLNDILYIEYKTGIAIEPPAGYHTEIFPRSSITKKNLFLANSIGLVDEGYRGEVIVRFKPTMDPRFAFYQGYKKGDKIAQLVVRKTETAEFVWSEALSATDRGSGGFGSSGN